MEKPSVFSPSIAKHLPTTRQTQRIGWDPTKGLSTKTDYSLYSGSFSKGFRSSRGAGSWGMALSKVCEPPASPRFQTARERQPRKR